MAIASASSDGQIRLYICTSSAGSGTWAEKNITNAVTLTSTNVSAASFSGGNVYATTVTATNVSATNMSSTNVTATLFSGTNVYTDTVTATTVSATSYQGLPATAVETHAIGFWVPGTLTTANSATPSFIVPKACTIVSAYAAVLTKPVTTPICADIHKNGTTIWSTQANRIQIAAAAQSGTQTAFNTTALGEGDQLTIDIDGVGTGTPGANLTVELKVTVP
jgi:uncharacterized protein YjbI with pentapeptide repeats